MIVVDAHHEVAACLETGEPSVTPVGLATKDLKYQPSAAASRGPTLSA